MRDLEEDDAAEALKPERFYWVAQFFSVALIVLAFAALTIAAHLVSVIEIRKMTEAQSSQL